MSFTCGSNVLVSPQNYFLFRTQQLLHQWLQIPIKHYFIKEFISYMTMTVLCSTCSNTLGLILWMSDFTGSFFQQQTECEYLAIIRNPGATYPTFPLHQKKEAGLLIKNTDKKASVIMTRMCRAKKQMRKKRQITGGIIKTLSPDRSCSTVTADCNHSKELWNGLFSLPGQVLMQLNCIHTFKKNKATFSMSFILKEYHSKSWLPKVQLIFLNAQMSYIYSQNT